MRKTAKPTSVTLTELRVGIKEHPWVHVCQVCAEDCGRIALVRLCYAFQVCTCKQAPYPHLIEHVYHKECFLKQDNEPGR